MDEGEAMIEGVGVNIGDFDDATDRHLVDQQFENSLVFVMFSLPSCSLDIFGECLSAYIAAPTWIANCRFAKRGIRTGGGDWHLICMVDAGMVATAHCIRRHQIRRHTFYFFSNAKIALERECFAAGRADAGGNAFV